MAQIKLDPATLLEQLAALGERFDLDQLLPELVALMNDLADALRDGKLSLPETLRLAAHLFRVASRTVRLAKVG